MDLASVVAALASVGVRVSGSTPNNNIQGDSWRACPTGLAGPEPSGTLNDPGQHFQIDGSRIHVRCSPRLGGELLCAPKQLRHYHSPDDLSWDEWRLNDSEVERIDLENAASPEEAEELEEMTANEMAVDGYYVVAGIAHHEYKQGWKFLTLWDGYGLSEATWEPMQSSYNQMEVSTPSSAPTSLRTTRGSY